MTFEGSPASMSDFSDSDLALFAERLAYVVSCYGPTARGAPAAHTLGITITCTPFESRAGLLAVALWLVGIGPGDYDLALETGPSDATTPLRPRDGFLQLAERERTYLSNIPVHTAMARLSRLLVRRGLLARLSPALTGEELRAMLGQPDGSPR